MNIIYSGATDVGKVRDHNEDAFTIIADRNLVMVCDGMGGHAAGEVASGIGIETISAIFNEFNLDLFVDKSLRFPDGITPEGKLLVGAIAVANHRIVERGRESQEQTGMGTTVVACHFGNGVVSICHVGDSRAYLIRDKGLKRVTVDHSWVSEVMEKHNLSEEESENLVNKNVITRALGTKPEIRTDISQLRVQKDDLFLLCSDGLCGMVNDGAILKTAIALGDNLDTLAHDLIRQANEAGGADNITICAARVVDHEENIEFQEFQRVTVDWNADPEASKIREIAASKFVPEKTAPINTVEDTAAFRAGPPGKSHRRGAFIFIFVLILIAVVVVWYFRAV